MPSFLENKDSDKFVYQKEEIVQLFEAIHKICQDFLENNDSDKFFSSYFSNVTAMAVISTQLSLCFINNSDDAAW